MALSQAQEEVVMRLTAAELDFARLYAQLPPAGKLAAADAQLRLRRRIRGEREPSSVPYYSGPLRLSAEAETLRRVAPARPKVCRDCAPVQLGPSRALDIRQRLRSAISASGLPITYFAEWVLGADPLTVHRYLRGEKIPRARRNWLQRLCGVTVKDGYVLVSVGSFQAGPRWNRRSKRVGKRT